MQRESSMQVSQFMWVLVAALLSHNLVIPVMSTSFEEQKNYFPFPDPHIGTPPSGSHGTPSHGSGGIYGSPPPSHGTPSHGGGYNPTPTPKPSPSTPSGGNCGVPPHKPSRPSHSPHGGYYHSPPTPVTVSPPTTPVIDPGTPSVPPPPSHFGGTCDFWRSHPSLIWGVLGWWGNVGSAFGVNSIPGFGATMTLPQALANTRTDGFGALYREGTASLLNSMVNNKFPFSTKQVRDSFAAALGSNSAAASQARLFKLANEGHLKPSA
ncbi:hypothetical protein PTKIN_Ptkin07bG0074300 [Pterospermum kingtungense]